jgi:tungstate transport system permease protein
VLAGFGRAIGEVGAVIVVGGNIAHATRIMTTSIALETSKGDLERALALGIVLLALSISVNALAASIGRRGLEVDG